MWPFSRKFPAVEAVEAEARDVEARIAKLRGELADISRQAGALVDSGTLESGIAATRQRARLKAQYEAAEYGVSGLQKRLAEAKLRKQQTLETIQQLAQKREQLLQRISAVQTDGEYEELATEMVGLLYRLAAVSGDGSFVERAQAVQADIDERTGCTTLQHSWARDANGKLVKESEMVGGGRHLYSAGKRIAKREADRLSIS